MKYTINFKRDKQDSINFFDCKSREDFEKENRGGGDFDEIVENSILNGYIKDESQICCFCDGSNNINPYFSSETAEYETQNTLENSVGWENYEGPAFSKEKSEYDFFLRK